MSARVMTQSLFFFFSSRRRHTRCSRDWSSDVCSSDLCTTAFSRSCNKRVRCFCGTEYGMTWTCEQTDARLSDYLDGLLEPAEQTAFDHHVNGCGRCTPLVAGVSQVLTSLHRLEDRKSTRLNSSHGY